MVGKLFHERPPRLGATLLDPGCGNGEFIEGVLRACQRNGWPEPQILGVEQSPSRAQTAQRSFTDSRTVEIREADFLQSAHERFDYIVGNPPYVAITGLDPDERERYREAYATAIGRFDLYALFFEQALRLLQPDGRLVFISPEKHPHQVSQWREQFLAGAATVFADGPALDPPVDVQALHAKIGELTLENDFLERALAKAGGSSAKR